MPAPISKEEIRELAGFTSRKAPVVTVYLDVDGEKYPRPQQYLAEFNLLSKSGLREWEEHTDTDPHELLQVRSELADIEGYLRASFVRDRTKGVVILSCRSEGLWRVVKLPVPTRSNITVGLEAYTRPLVALLERHDRFCTVVIDRRKARVFTVYLGDIDEHFGVITDDVPAHVKGGEWAGLRGNKIVHHIEDHVHRHLKHVSDQLLEFFRSKDFDRLIVGGHPDFIPRFIERLHPYLADRLAGTFQADPVMPLERVLDESLEVDRESRVRREQDVISNLVERGGPGRRVALGAGEAIDAINANEAHMLVLGSDFQGAGYFCRECHNMALDPGNCPVHGTNMVKTADLAEEMVQAALLKGVKVYQISEHPEFSDQPGVAATLRYQGQIQGK